MFGSNNDAARITKLETELAEIKSILRVLVNKQNAAPAGGQLVSTQVNNAIQSACNATEKRVYEQIQTHLVPVMKDQVQWLNYQTEDTHEQITNYQMDQMLGPRSSGGDLKKVSQGSRAQLHLGQW